MNGLECLNLCLQCGVACKVYDINSAGFHGLCHQCAVNLNTNKLNCIICKTWCDLEFLKLDEKTKDCDNCKLKFCARQKCERKKHIFCKNCFKKTCDLCNCTVCLKPTDDRIGCVQHPICKLCFDQYGDNCSLCKCRGCGERESSERREKCKHPVCKFCLNKNCLMCIKKCVFCGIEGYHNIKRCYAHYSCRDCFDHFFKEMNGCPACNNEVENYRCLECKKPRKSAKSFCKTGHLFCEQCSINKCLYCGTCESCNNLMLIKTRDCGHKICQDCGERCIPCENKVNCNNCGRETTKNVRFTCGHFACDGCVRINQCQNCIKKCSACNKMRYNLFKYQNCQHEVCESCSNFSYDCNNHRTCITCYQNNQYCEICVKECSACKKKTYIFHECDKSKHVTCSDCGPVNLPCGQHQICKTCFELNPDCLVCSKKCFGCGKNTYKFSYCQDYEHLVCPECESEILPCGNHKRCKACTQNDPNCSKCLDKCFKCKKLYYNLKKYLCGIHRACDACFNQEECELCFVSCKTCNMQGYDRRKYYHCNHYYCSEECKKYNGEYCEECTTCRVCQTKECKNLFDVCSACVNKLYFSCNDCKNLSQKLESVCGEKHSYCDKCLIKNRQICPLCNFFNLISGKCESCNRYVEEIRNYNCNMHKYCYDCATRNNGNCTIPNCSICNQHALNVISLDCNHNFCEACFNGNQIKKCRLCCEICKNTDNGEKLYCNQCGCYFCNQCCGCNPEKCKNCDPKCYYCQLPGIKLCEDVTHILCKDHSFGCHDLCKFCSGDLRFGNCGACNSESILIKCLGQHFSCSKCFDFNTNECRVCYDEKMCESCRIKPYENEYICQSGKFKLCGDCLLLQVCFNCNQNNSTTKVCQKHGICEECLKITNTCNICTKNCLICGKNFKLDESHCEHVCIGCIKTFDESCIFCTKKNDEHMCSLCNKYLKIIINTEKGKICLNCHILKIQQNECHTCNNKLIMNELTQLKCQFLVCSNCKLYNYFQACPICDKFRVAYCLSCEKNNYIVPDTEYCLPCYDRLKKNKVNEPYQNYCSKCKSEITDAELSIFNEFGSCKNCYNYKKCLKCNENKALDYFQNSNINVCIICTEEQNKLNYCKSNNNICSVCNKSKSPSQIKSDFICTCNIACHICLSLGQKDLKMIGCNHWVCRKCLIPSLVDRKALENKCAKCLKIIFCKLHNSLTNYTYTNSEKLTNCCAVKYCVKCYREKARFHKCLEN